MFEGVNGHYQTDTTEKRKASVLSEEYSLSVRLKQWEIIHHRTCGPAVTPKHFRLLGILGTTDGVDTRVRS